jgi:hypothetical protein
MAFHKLKIGQTVHYRSSKPRQNNLRGTYRIINLLPQREDGESEYRIRVWRNSMNWLRKKVS